MRFCMWQNNNHVEGRRVEKRPLLFYCMGVFDPFLSGRSAMDDFNRIN